MSNKMPLPPVDGIGSDNETGEEQQPLSKAELRRREKEESRQRAKLQKVELEKIRREMKQPVSKTSLILGTLLVVFFLILVVGGYYFYCYYRINLWRKMFMDEYNKANLADISKYAPDYLERVEKYRELAERGGSIIGAEEVRQQYEEAAKVLREALDKLQEERDRYRTAKEKLDTARHGGGA